MGRMGTTVVAFALAAAACGDSNADDPGARAAAVYEAILTDIAIPEAPSVDDAPPVIYAVGDGTDPIGAGVQAAVADAMKDAADVRFSDVRADVIDGEDEREPVVDDALLVVLGPVPERGRRIEVPIELYRSQGDQQSIVVTLMKTGDVWAVRSTAAT